jgi:hypothetical protein
MRFSRVVALAVLGASVCFPLSSIAEENKKQKIEEMVDKPVPKNEVDLNSIRRGKLTEEQATAQLKFMMVKGWERIEDDLIERGSFKPMGMILQPDGEFKPLRIEGQDEYNQEFVLNGIVESLKEIAKTRSVWAVGIIWVTGKKQQDGTYYKQIMVLTEHIAGWARHWAYPYKLVDGEIKLGSSIETQVKPIYFK